MTGITVHLALRNKTSITICIQNQTVAARDERPVSLSSMPFWPGARLYCEDITEAVDLGD